jgi:serine palmitoyltransferase
VFKHNDPEDLERVLRDSIVEGQPRTRRPWKKIIIIVEGIYSMEGEIAKLKEIVALKKKYKAYLYVDEAHSIGALGKTGRGVCEHTGVDPKDVDVLMGTFTKAFGSVGGYVASSEEIISYLRHIAYSSVYATAMSPPCAQQALSALKVIMGEDGTDSGQKRLRSLHDNSNFFRNSLTNMGFHVIGDKDSPIVPLMVYHPAKFPLMSRALFDRNIIIVVVGFPVTPLLLSRIRFCISAAHTREDLEWALKQISELGDLVLAKYGGIVDSKSKLHIE